LNLGHTVGHALEPSRITKISHGGSIDRHGGGSVLAEQIGLAQVGLAERIASILAGFGLPTHIPSGLKWEAILAAMQVDKRNAGQAACASPCRQPLGDVHAGMVLMHSRIEKLASFAKINVY
jgi:3-dehydroquinate synthetase